MALTDTSVKALKAAAKPTKHSDGGGLHILVNPTGSKLWRMAYRYDGKQKLLAFGAYPAVSLADARRKRDEAKALLAKGTDPAHNLKMEKIAKQASNALTFGLIADEFIAKCQKEGKADATLTKKRWLLDLAIPDIGSRPIADLSAAEILIPLRRIESKGNYETARRMRSTIGQVFRYAIATARVANDPTFGLRGALTAPVVTHRAAITNANAFGGLLRAIWSYDGNPETRIALQLMAILYPRPGELRQAEWSEFDLEKGVWTIPASRMKMRREHRKPIPSSTITLLRDLYKLTGDCRFAFPAVHTRQRTMSENTLNTALRRMGFTHDQATSHGFRASASSLLNECGLWAPDAIEAELAHVGADEVRKAYHRALYWEERVKMSGWWARRLDEIRTS
ncbi:MAG: integrase arm-type DNA-binding domain-containing protein [Rhizobium sp.]|nr:integrase arm-type DNA-binding domain-containing protein [Rhizobium sp.]